MEETSGREKMIEIPYEDFVELTIMKGRVDATLTYLNRNRGYVSGDEIIALLTGEVKCGAE